MQTLRRAIPLFYAFDRINYKKQAPLYYEDCLALPNKFPKLFEAFCREDFVVTKPFLLGQPLEMQYNKSAKGQLGIIGMTKKKEAVNKWIS